MESISTRRSTLILFFLLFLVVAITATLYLVQTRQEIRQEAAANTTVTLVPQSASIVAGQNVTFDVDINTGSDSVTAITMEINYNPMYLEAKSIVAPDGGPFSKRILKNPEIDNNNGIIRMSLGYDFESGAGFTGDTANPIIPPIAQITFTSKLATNQTTVSFNDNETDLATSVNPNMYLDAKLDPGSIAITSGNETPADSIVKVSTDKSSYNVSDTVSATVSVNPGNNSLTGVDITINFDKNLLEGSGVSIGQGLNYCSNATEGKFENGVIRMRLCQSDLQSRMTSEGTIFTLSFKALTNGSTNIVINDVSAVSGDGSNASLIKSKQNASITIGSGNNPAPTATPGTSCTNTRPVTPTNLKATAGTGDQVKLSWTQVATNVTHYGIKYGIKSKNYVYGASNIGNTNSFTVAGLTKGYTYYFVVYAVNDCIAGEDSQEASINLSAGLGGIFGAKTSPAPKNSVPPPATGFASLPKSSTNPFLASNPKASVAALPKVNIPTKTASQSGFLSSPFALYVGIFLIILSLFLGIYFFRMRRY